MSRYNQELQKFISAERKKKRDLAELYSARKSASEKKNPDAKILKLIDDEIAAINKGETQ